MQRFSFKGIENDLELDGEAVVQYCECTKMPLNCSLENY